jgi:hypothetical protein
MKTYMWEWWYTFSLHFCTRWNGQLHAPASLPLTKIPPLSRLNVVEKTLDPAAGNRMLAVHPVAILTLSTHLQICTLSVLPMFISPSTHMHSYSYNSTP